jgi:hypothetical protein
MNLRRPTMDMAQIVRWWPEAERVLARRSEASFALRKANAGPGFRRSIGSAVDPKFRDLTPKEWR